MRTSLIALALWAATLVVAGLGIGREIWVFHSGAPLAALRLFNLDGENTLPAWYSAMLMWTAAGLLALQALTTGGRTMRLYWWALAAIFAYLSLDETVGLHEVGNRVLPGVAVPAFFGFRWVIVAGPIVALVGLAFVPFLQRLPRAIALRIVLSGTVYVGGAYGMELVGSYIAATQGMASRAYFIAVTAEETLEMVGLTLFILVLLDLLAAVRDLTIRLRS